MKLLTVIGARPQFIKAATISRQVATRDDICEVIVHTGQHYDENMSNVFFEQMAIPLPNYSLKTGGVTHGAMTGRQLEQVEQVLIQEKPDCVLVYGDTNSTLAGALAAVKLHIPVAHVEAGLRSFNRAMPEEINRILTDHISTLLFPPTSNASEHLAAEGICRTKIHVSGDVMYDATKFYLDRATKPLWFDEVGAEPGDFVLATVHRAENTDHPQRLQAILNGLAEATSRVILPLHPRTKARLLSGDFSIGSNLKLVPPVGYLEMLWLEANCTAIATDSGGVQKEAYFHNKPCITLRDETEWVELVEAKANVLAGANTDTIARLLSTPPWSFERHNLYGDGNSATRILDVLSKPTGMGVARGEACANDGVASHRKAETGVVNL